MPSKLIANLIGILFQCLPQFKISGYFDYFISKALELSAVKSPSLSVSPIAEAARDEETTGVPTANDSAILLWNP